MRKLTSYIIILITLCCGPEAAAQLLNTLASTDTVTAIEPTTPAIRVSLITCSPGRDIYALEGHSGLRIVIGEDDVVVNWGLFDFASPNFVYRFVKGETDYMVGLTHTSNFLDNYQRERRRVAEQVLNLTDRQAQMVVDMVGENLLPQNRVYRYNYVKDNCATRPLNIIAKAVGDSIVLAQAFGNEIATPTFRNVMRHYHANYPWYQFGIDLCLGSGIDYLLDNGEIAFAPDALERMVAGAVILTPEGERPLVRQTNVLVDYPLDNAVAPATPWVISPVCIFALLMILTLALTVRDLRRRKLTRAFDVVLYLSIGLVGCIVAFLVFVSEHEATSPNWLLLWINPLCLLIAAAELLRLRRKWVAMMQMVNVVAMFAYVAVIALGIQDFNPAFILILITDLCRASARIYLK